MAPTLTEEQRRHVEQLARAIEEAHTVPPHLLAPFARLPRHWFVDQVYLADAAGAMPTWPRAVTPETTDPDLLSAVYSDHALCIQVCGGVGTSSTSQPSLMAQMMADAGLQTGARVLEIGTGTGWNGALMADVVGPTGRVVSLECDQELAAAARRHLAVAGYEDRVEVRHTDGVAGAADAAPFDAILVTVGCPDIPRPWLEQLAEGGRLVMPFALPDESAPLLRLVRRGDTWSGEFLRWTWFVALRGGALADWPAPLRAADHAAWQAAGGRSTWRHTPAPSASLLLWLLAHDAATVIVADDANQGRRNGTPGLMDAAGLAVLGDNGVLGYGDEATAQRLAAHVEAWHAAGRPEVGAWRAVAERGGAVVGGAALRRVCTCLRLDLGHGSTHDRQ
jgi:protein-L-isoaspartate(D-aspartate) O-methyltransferase